nr:nucleoside-diphosphate sugar epimerase/dehydratase [Prochlorococcus marinus]
MRDFILKIKISKNKNRKKVIIYGAGEAGAQLASSLIQDGRYCVEGFIDDDSSLWRRNIKGIPIYPPNRIYENKAHIDQVLLAIPSLRKKKRLEILHTLYKKGVSVLQIPSIDEIKSEKNLITSLKPVKVEDILGREPINPDNNLLNIAVKGQTVCITGAGGSIGSELSKQIYNLNPYKMILIDHSESHLYNINKQITSYPDNGIEVKAILGSTTDLPFINKVFTDNNVDIIFHAAAYKHVPLVESNPLKGLFNNVFSTEIVCKAALEAGANNLVLISTDKAVRPTNVMGASKRLSELVVQAIAEKSKENSIAKKTCFSMVRFGNVLGSSGSVLPLFQEQIDNGGPITLTHPRIIRYFMTISEASQLVIQSKVLAEGGDVFHLDMGKPVSIKSLAEQLILLNGLSIKDNKNLEGDIEIKFTGLRPGEKLYEELIIDAESKKTIHPLIYRADERFIPLDIIMPTLEILRRYLDNEDKINSLLILKELVPEWQTNLI